MENKKCNNCNIIKPLNSFKSNGYSKKGTRTYKPKCKYCMNIEIRNDLKDKIIIVRGNAISVTSEAKIKRREYQKNYREKNREVLREKARQYYYNTPEQIKKKRQRRNTILAKKRREEQILEKIKKARN